LASRLSIPYENLDIHLGVPLTLDPDRIFAKLVDERRGGWCYEMNGLFAAVLEAMGFDVRRVSGTVGRARHGGRAQGNHLVLIVTLDRRWIVDVGFGDGFLAPLPLEPGTYTQSFLRYRVSRDGSRWRVDNHLRRGGRVRLHPDVADAGRVHRAVPRAADASRLGLRQNHRLRALHA
jgi:N-hydroxyarylamine O-acetyltransferase